MNEDEVMKLRQKIESFKSNNDEDENESNSDVSGINAQTDFDAYRSGYEPSNCCPEYSDTNANVDADANADANADADADPVENLYQQTRLERITSHQYRNFFLVMTLSTSYMLATLSSWQLYTNHVGTQIDSGQASMIVKVVMTYVTYAVFGLYPLYQYLQRRPNLSP